MPITDKPVELTENVLEALEKGEKTATDAVRQFVDTLDKALPVLEARGEAPSRRREVIDAALEMADKLVTTQVDFLRSVVRATGKALESSENGKS